MEKMDNQIKNAFANVQSTINSLLRHKTNAFLENYISETYIEKQIAKDCLPTSYNWWTGICNNKNYAIHIDDSIKPFDIAFAKELKQANYEIIFVNINDFEQKVTFIYENEEYDLETLVEKLSLKENIREKKENKNINNEIYEWCLKNLDYKKLIYHSAIEICFLSKYFNYLTNLDMVWANVINGQVQFFIGEVKFKSKNKENVFIMNVGEKILYENIVNKTNIKVVAIALISSKKERQVVLQELMKNNNFPIFYMNLKKETFLNLTMKEGNLSDFDKQNGKQKQNTIDFPFYKFQRLMDFSEIGKDNTNFVSTLNKTITKYSHLFGENFGVATKHIAKFYTLFQMMNDGFNIDYNDFLNKKDINSNILEINNKKVLFKFVESKKSWNLTLEKSEFEYAKDNKVDYILVYRDEKNFSIKNIGQGVYLANEENKENSIKILGCISFDIFEKYHHTLKAGIPKSQPNYYVVRGCNPKYKEYDYAANGKASNQDTYFLQVLNWKYDNSDKEKEECQLIVYDKSKNLPFLSSYVFY